MDLGDIMEEWERVSGGKDGRAAGGGRAGSAKREAGSARPAEGTRGAPQVRRLQELWLERYGVDPAIAEADEPGRPRSKKEIDAMPADAVLDLHGMTGAEAESALAAFFQDAMAKRCSKVLIVHGKGLHSQGEAVLGRVVARWLERRPEAGRHGHPDRSRGGLGATWVMLKGADQRSR